MLRACACAVSRYGTHGNPGVDVVERVQEEDDAGAEGCVAGLACSLWPCDWPAPLPKAG